MFYTAMSYLDLKELAKEKIVLLPLGATEQHGPHLAVGTDTDIVTEIAISAEKELTDSLILCPSLPFGSSHHHLSFGGTISMSAELYTKLIVDILHSLLQNGFRRIVLLNGHGGNITPVKQALSAISKLYDASLKPYIALATYWELAAKSFSGQPPMQSPALSHACEYETSLMLHLFAEKVCMEKVQRAVRPVSNGYVPWEDDEVYKGITVMKQTEFISNNGCSGEPQLATKEKGEYLFNEAVTQLVQFLHSFQQWPLLENLKHA